MRVGQLRIDSGVWDVGLAYIPIEDIAIFCCGFSIQIPDSTWVLTLSPAYNFEPQYRVTLFTSEDWTKATGAPPAVKGLVWFTGGSRMAGGDRGWNLWAIGRTKAQVFPG